MAEPKIGNGNHEACKSELESDAFEQLEMAEALLDDLNVSHPSSRLNK